MNLSSIVAVLSKNKMLQKYLANQENLSTCELNLEVQCMLDHPPPLVLEKLASCISEVSKRHRPISRQCHASDQQHVTVSIRGTSKLDASGFVIFGSRNSFRRLVPAGLLSVPTNAA